MGAEPIVSVCLAGFPGANAALIHLSRTTGLTRHVSLASTRLDSPEIPFLVEYLTQRRPPLVLLGGWSPVYEALVSALHNATVPAGVYWTSSGGQTDISQEVPKLAHILQDRRLDSYFFCTQDLTEALQRVGRQAFSLPLTFAVPPPAPRPRALERQGGARRLSLFCPAPEYHRKNILNCLLALSLLRGDYQLLLNGLSAHAEYRTMLELLRVPYMDLGWMSKEQYEERLWSIDIGLQCSFAESYNYVAAEHLMRGIPVVASRMTPVMLLLSAQTQAELIVDAADSPRALRERLQALVDAPTDTAALGSRAREELLAANQHNISLATHILRTVVARHTEKERRDTHA